MQVKLYPLVLFGLSILFGACATPQTTTPGAAPSTTPPIVTPQDKQIVGVAPSAQSNAAPAVPGPRKDGPVRPDTSKAIVPLDEIISGGPPPDGIPPIDTPKFETPTEANAWLKDREPVVAVSINADSRAYPLQLMTWHEIVNDNIGGIPVTVTFCPLCNTALAFDRRLKGIIYDFGTSGKLYNSDLVMYDRQTHTYWSQVLGKAIVGDLVGEELTPVAAQIVSWADFKQAYPQGKVLSRDTGHVRDYGRNPYAGYDDINETPFLYRGTIDGRLAAMERVVLVTLGGVVKAYPFSALAKQGVVADKVGGQDIVVFHRPGTASALAERTIAEARDVGAAAVYSPLVNGRKLTFEPTEPGFRDKDTGSVWSILGLATTGPLAGQSLTPIVHGNHFWFASAAFYPIVQVWSPR